MWILKETQPKHRQRNRPHSFISGLPYWIPVIGLILGIVLRIEWLLAFGVLVTGLIVLKMLAEYGIKLYVIQYREKRQDDLLT